MSKDQSPAIAFCNYKTLCGKPVDAAVYLHIQTLLYSRNISFPPNPDIGENDYFLFVFLSNFIIEKDIYH